MPNGRKCEYLATGTKTCFKKWFIFGTGTKNLCTVWHPNSGHRNMSSNQMVLLSISRIKCLESRHSKFRLFCLALRSFEHWTKLLVFSILVVSIGLFTIYSLVSTMLKVMIQLQMLYSCWLDQEIAPPTLFSLASWFWWQP